MLVYRISKSEFSNDLSGTGAGLYGGRWNPKGLNMIYTAASISLASLEFLAHNFHLINTMEVALSIIEIPSEAGILEFSIDQLPPNWNSKLSTLQLTQDIGFSFLLHSGQYLLKVPSVIVPRENNILLNPAHPLHSKTKVVEQINPFKLDSRLYGK